MAEKPVVTNAMRLLKAAGIDFETREYEVDESDLSGVHAAEVLGLPPEQVFKTLVTRGPGGYFVFVIPAGAELDLKAAARAAGQKSVEMIPVKEINAVTGYIRGGCSPVGMKKLYPTVLDESALREETIMVSAGKIGAQVELSPADLIAAVRAATAPITVAHTASEMNR